MMKYEELESKRDYKLLDKEIKNPELRLRTLLFKNEDFQAVGKFIRNLWELRKSLLTQINPQDNDNSCITGKIDINNRK